MKEQLKSFVNDLELNKTTSSVELDLKHLNLKTKFKYYSSVFGAVLIGASLYAAATLYVKSDDIKRTLINEAGYTPLVAYLEPNLSLKSKDIEKEISTLFH